MKLINNQDTRLYDELKSKLTNDSIVYISSSYFSILALYELSDLPLKVKSIKILLKIKIYQMI